MARSALSYFKNAAPGALDRLPRTYSAFDLPAAFERVKFTLGVRGKPNGCVALNSNAIGPWKNVPPVVHTGRRILQITNGEDDIITGPDSSAQLILCGDRDAGRLFKAFFAGTGSRRTG